MVQQIKVRTKLLVSFSLLVVFTIVVGYMGIRGINQINYQNEISELANRILVDSQDVQTGSLRYIIYQDDQYMDMAEEETGNVLSNAQAAEDLMLSEENKVHTRELMSDMTEYHGQIEEYATIQNQINLAGERRAEAAQQVLDNVVAMVEAARAGIEQATVNGRVEKVRVDRLEALQAVRDGTNRFRITAQKYQLALTEEERTSMGELWESQINEVEVLIARARVLSDSEQMLDYLDDSLESLKLYRDNVDTFQYLEQQQLDIQERQREASQRVGDSAREIRDGVREVIDRVTRNNTLLALVFALVSAVLGILIAIILTKSITSQLGGEPYEIVEVTGKIAQGDLNIQFPERKLTGVYASMQDMTNQLTTIVNDIVGASEQITSGSEQISSTAQQISSGTSEQASNMEEVSASIEELNANIQQNTDNSQQSNSMAKKVADDSQEGSEAVAETVTAMKEIAEKISVIQDIARSTNMLALNAAIEAARAGEAGRGFAVVASEVRKLAESSGNAAKEITEITQNSVHRAIAAQEMIEQVVPAMRKTADLVEEITMASQEQNKGSEQINAAVVQLDTVIQQNASASEELASMSEELLSQATAMKDTIGFFKAGKKTNQRAVKNLEYKTDEHNEKGFHQSSLKQDTRLAEFETKGDYAPSGGYEQDFEEF